MRPVDAPPLFPGLLPLSAPVAAERPSWASLRAWRELCDGAAGDVYSVDYDDCQANVKPHVYYARRKTP